MTSSPTPASLFIERLRRAYTSPAVLFYLKSLSKTELKASAIGSGLLEIAEELGLSRFDEKFFGDVNRHVKLMKPTENCFFVAHGKKTEAIEAFKKEVESRRAKAKDDRFAYLGASSPFCVQFLLPRPKSKNVSPFTGSLFFIFSTYEQGLRKCVEILRHGYVDHAASNPNFKFRRFTQLYEIRLRDGIFSDEADRNLGYLILDWEVEEPKLRREDGTMRLERHEIEALCQEFPLWFYRRLLSVGAVTRDAVVSSKFFLFINPIFFLLFILPPARSRGEAQVEGHRHGRQGFQALQARHRRVLRRALCGSEDGLRPSL